MRREWGVVLILLLVWAAMTYPLALEFDHSIPGFFSTDESFNNLWDSWRIHTSWEQKLPFHRTDLIVFPIGYEMYASGFFSYLWLAVVYLLSILTTPVLTFNLQLAANMLLSAWCAYLLARRLTGSRKAALIAGLIFGFCPFQFARSWQHLGLTYTQWIPLSIWAGLRYWDAPCRRNFLILAGSLVLMMSFDWILMFIGAIAYFLCIAYLGVRSLRNKEPRSLKRTGALGAAFAAAVLILSPQFFPVVKNMVYKPAASQAAAEASGYNPYHRPFEDLFSQSARPLSYFLPGHSHPLFGGFTAEMAGSDLYGRSFTEHTLYIGWTALICAWWGVRRWRRERAPHAGYFALLAVAAWFLSQPPWWEWFGFKVYMPSSLLYKVFPMMRAYCRFAILLQLGVAMLAAYGITGFLRRRRNHGRATAAACLIAALVLFEYWPWPGPKVIDVSQVPAAYEWLAAEPKDTVIAVYPLDLEGENPFFKFYQTRHGKKMINGAIPGLPGYAQNKALEQLSSPLTQKSLKERGVRYIFVHTANYLATDLESQRREVDAILASPGLRLKETYPAQPCEKEQPRCIRDAGEIKVFELSV